MRCTWSAFETSIASPSASGRAAAVALAPEPLMSAATTLAPSSASFCATARPIPWADPVTIATRSCNFIGFSLLELVEVGRVPVRVPRVHVV